MTRRYFNLTIIEFLTLVLLFLFALSVFNLAGTLLASLFVVCFLFFVKRTQIINGSIIVLLFFSAAYFITYMSFWSCSIKEVITYLIAPWASYLFGVAIVRNSKNKYMFEIVVLTLAIGFFIHGILNLNMSLATFGFESNYRIAIDFWRKEYISVTGCSLYYVPLTGLSVGYVFLGTKKWAKVFAFVAIALGTYANITYINRTALYMLAILGALGVINILKTKTNGNKKIVMVFSVCIVIALTLIFDVFGIRTALLELKVIDRLMGNEVGRLVVWQEFLFSDWWKYPFGGEQIVLKHGFAHNLWLDVLYTVGLIPFILLSVFTVQSFSTVKRFYLQDKSKRGIYIFMLLAMAINSMVEPVLSANPYFFLIMIMLLGCMEGQIGKQGDVT